MDDRDKQFYEVTKKARKSEQGEQALRRLADDVAELNLWMAAVCGVVENLPGRDTVRLDDATAAARLISGLSDDPPIAPDATARVKNARAVRLREQQARRESLDWKVAHLLGRS